VTFEGNDGILLKNLRNNGPQNNVVSLQVSHNLRR
jgi:hypothetical protein